MKGMKEKAEQGIFPSRAPYGYKNIRNSQGKNDIAVDDLNAPFIKRAFEIYSCGTISLMDTAQQLLDEGFCYRSYQKRIPKSALEQMLKNPFYTGVFKFKGEIMQGKHTPLITKKLFQKVQSAFTKDGKPLYRKQEFLLGNFLTCGDCGCSIIGEIKKGKYIYYHCSWGHGRDNCNNKKYYKEQEIFEKLEGAIKAIQIDSGLKQEILNAIIELNKQSQSFQEDNLKRLNACAEKLRREISLIYQDKLDGNISHEQWKEENEIRRQRLETVKIKIEALDTTNQKFMTEVNSILELLENLYDKYLQANDANKVRLLKSVLSNCTIEGENVH